LIWEGKGRSFSTIDRESAEIASGLRARGIGPGERVAVGFPNSPELVTTVLAVLRSGAALVPLNPAYPADEAGYIVGDSAPALILTHDAQAAALREITARSPVPPNGCASTLLTSTDDLRASIAGDPPLRPEDPALIIYTSGTTGRPKGAVLSHGALLSNLTTIAAAWRWTERDRLLLTLPCFHLHGLGLGILGSFLVGSSVVMRARFVAEETPRLLAEHECTMFFGVPTMYNRLVTLPESALEGIDFGGMRMWVSGSAPLGPATFERFRERFGFELLDRYGMTECGFVVATPYGEARRPGTVGRPLPGIEVRIVDADEADAGRLVPARRGEPGEVLMRGPNLFSGYWRREEETRAAFLDGFLRSGDLAIEDEDGMIRIVGRRSVDVIKSRGFKIGAIEIENCLQAHPAVAEVAVVGVPHADLGEIVVAVVCRAPGKDVSPEGLRAYAREHLAPHKVPGRIVFRDQIPRTGPGKFKKRQLIDDLVEELHPSA
jgi:malonyl-CoA/methylmalonyl-CoA synthetase